MIANSLDGSFVHDKLVSFDEDASGLIIKHEQHIPDEYVSQLKRDKIDALHEPAGDFYRFASIPVVVVEKWMREGFDINHANAHEIMSRLRKEQLDAFITTNKSI